MPSLALGDPRPLRQPHDARHESPPPGGAAIVAQFHPAHFGTHLVIQELDDAGQFRWDQVGRDNEADAPGREVRLDLAPEVRSLPLT